jgi:hypothetical protein
MEALVGFRIRSTQDSSAFVRVSEKTNADSPQKDQRQGQDSEQKEKEEPQRFEVSDETVREAIQQFSNDAQARNAGVQAEILGQGPGLRVVLKDGRGAFLRQMSGEEFLKLRETVSALTSPGKILDRKL